MTHYALNPGRKDVGTAYRLQMPPTPASDLSREGRALWDSESQSPALEYIVCCLLALSIDKTPKGSEPQSPCLQNGTITATQGLVIRTA